MTTAWPFNPHGIVLGWGAAMLATVFARWAVSWAFLRREQERLVIDAERVYGKAKLTLLRRAEPATDLQD